MTSTRSQPFVTPDELKRAQADSRAATKADPWTSRYVRGSLSSLAPPESANGHAAGGAGSNASSRAASPSPSPAAETIKATLASNRGLGSAMPSSINRDLRTSNASSLSFGPSSGRASTSSVSTVGPGGGAAADLSISSDYTSPTLEGQDGTLSKVVGSLVDPVESRKTWACAGCGIVFARDSTIYASPENSQRPQQQRDGNGMMREKKSSSYFCRGCFMDRFSMGICANPTCGKPVLGSTKEDGKFVRAGEAALYHGRCWRCDLCGRGGGLPPLGDGEPIMVGLDGQPTCEDCFGKKRPSSAATTTRAAAAPGPPLERQRTISKARPHSTTYVATVPDASGQAVGSSEPAANAQAKRETGSTSTKQAGSKGPPQTTLSRGDTLKARPHSVDLTARPGYSRGLSGASLSRFSQQGSMGTGSAGGTVAQLSKRFGSMVSPTAASPRLNGFASPTLGSGLFSSSSSTTIAAPSPLSTPTLDSCPTPRLTRTNSVTGSPPKPRPLTATFSAEKGFNLGAFNATGRDVEGAIRRSDSRSRSVSPVRRNGRSQAALNDQDAPAMRTTEFGSSSLMDSGGTDMRRSTSKGPFSSESSGSPQRTPVQEKEADEADDAMRCAACGLGAFDGPNASSDDAVLVTLRQGVQLHAQCLRCSICTDMIDPQRTFIRLDDSSYPELGPGLGAFAHPKCAPTITVVRPKPAQDASKANLSRPSLDVVSDDEHHPTHQRAPRPSQETQPPPSSVAANKTILDFAKHGGPSGSTRQLANGWLTRHSGVQLRPSGLPGGGHGSRETFAHASKAAGGTGAQAMDSMPLRRFQPSAGAAPPTRSSVNVTTRGVPSYLTGLASQGQQAQTGAGLSGQRNPAAGIFARRMAEINSRVGPQGGLPASSAGGGGGPTKLGGMPTCAGCNTKLTMLESVAGPRGTAWHRACLVCGGDLSLSTAGGDGVLSSVPAPRRANVLGSGPVLCGKKLDSGAKVNVEGRVRCRECYDREAAARRQGNGNTYASGKMSSDGLPLRSLA